MTCLSIIQDACQSIGIPSPTAVVTSSDSQVLQLLGLLNKEGKELARRPEEGWQALTFEANFTTVATENQTLVSAVAPNYRFIINDTIWNRSQRRPVFGPLSPQMWQKQKGWFPQGPYSQYRIEQNYIKFMPVPAAGESCYFEYVTKNWVTTATGTAESFTADTDTSLLDEYILTLGLIWRWKAAKGLDYADDFRTYQAHVDTAIARDVPRNILRMDNGLRNTIPNLYVQDGNFPAA